MSIDYGTPEGQVRLLIPDTATDDGTPSGSYVFTDDQIEAFLEVGKGNILRSAAYAMLALANNEALILKHVKSYDLQVSGPAVADALRKNAGELMARAREEDDEANEGAFQIVDLVPRHALWPEGSVRYAPRPLGR